MAIQFPGQTSQVSLPAIDQSLQQNEFNALRNDALRQTNQQRQGQMDSGKAQEVGQFLTALGEDMQARLQQDPSAYARLMPEIQQRFQQLGLPTEKMPPAGTSPQQLIEDFAKLQEAGEIALHGLPQQKEDPRESTSQIRNERYRQKMIAAGKWTAEDQARFDASVRAPKVATIGGVPSRVTGTDVEPLGTLDEEVDARRQIKTAETEAGASVVPAGDRVAAYSKYPRMQAARRDLDGVRAAHDDLMQNETFQGGPMQGGGLALTKAGQSFQRYVDSLMSHVAALTRIPGVGAQSDWEGRLQQAPLPSLNQHPQVRLESIASLEALVNDLEQAVVNVTSGSTEQMAVEPETPSTVIKYDAEGKRIE